MNEVIKNKKKWPQLKHELLQEGGYSSDQQRQLENAFTFYGMGGYQRLYDQFQKERIQSSQGVSVYKYY